MKEFWVFFSSSLQQDQKNERRLYWSENEKKKRKTPSFWWLCNLGYLRVEIVVSSILEVNTSSESIFRRWYRRLHSSPSSSSLLLLPLILVINVSLHPPRLIFQVFFFLLFESIEKHAPKNYVISDISVAILANRYFFSIPNFWIFMRSNYSPIRAFNFHFVFYSLHSPSL